MSDELPESPESVADAQRQTVVLLAVLVEGGLLAGASLLGWMIDQHPLLHFAWTWQAVVWGVLATVPLVIFFFVFLRWPIGPFRRIQRFSERVLRPLLAPCSLIDLLGISALAGLGEEMLFRGVLQEAFTGWFNVWAGVIAASVLFGVLHSITFTYAMLAAVMGVYLGCIFRYADHNLLAAIIAQRAVRFRCAPVADAWSRRRRGARRPRSHRSRPRAILG